jgi:hypothetical protein
LAIHSPTQGHSFVQCTLPTGVYQHHHAVQESPCELCRLDGLAHAKGSRPF